MKLNDLRTLIREEIQNELAEVKKKKKKDEAKKKIMEIIVEAELTEEDLEEANFLKTALGKGIQTVKNVGDKFGFGKSKPDTGEVNNRFTSPAAKIDAYLSFFGQRKNITDEQKKEVAEDPKKMDLITKYLAVLGDLVGYDNIKTTKMGAKIKDKDGKEIRLDLATAGNKGIASPGTIWKVKSQAGNSANFVTGTGE